MQQHLTELEATAAALGVSAPLPSTGLSAASITAIIGACLLLFGAAVRGAVWATRRRLS